MVVGMLGLLLPAACWCQLPPAVLPAACPSRCASMAAAAAAGPGGPGYPLFHTWAVGMDRASPWAMHVPKGLHVDLLGAPALVFRGALLSLDELYFNCCTIAEPDCSMHTQWLVDGPPLGLQPFGLPPPDKPECLTGCILATKLDGFLNGAHATGHHFKLAVAPGYTRNSWSLKKGYLKVKAGHWLFGQPFPCSELYLHQVLCFMYRGPPTNPGHIVLHLCETKLCLCPWHVMWGTRGENRVLAVKKRKRQLGPLQPHLSQSI